MDVLHQRLPGVVAGDVDDRVLWCPTCAVFDLPWKPCDCTPDEENEVIVVHQLGRDPVALETRYPADPLFEYAPQPTAYGLGRLFRVNHPTAQRWAEHGLTSVEADRMATKIGLYAPNLWPGFMDDEMETDDGND